MFKQRVLFDGRVDLKRKRVNGEGSLRTEKHQRKSAIHQDLPQRFWGKSGFMRVKILAAFFYFLLHAVHHVMC